MAILRGSEPVQVSRAAPAKVQGSGGARYVAPDVRKFYKGPSTSDIVLDAVGAAVKQVGQKAWEAQKEEAYVEGVQAASIGMREQDLNSDPFMGDWAKAGFRDTAARARHAEWQAKIPDAMKSALASDAPELAFDTWMYDQTGQMNAQFQGMSRKGRAAMFAQLATDIPAAHRTFGGELAAFRVQKEISSIQAKFTANRTMMEASRNNPAAYASAAQGFVADVYTSVVANDRLPPDAKAKLVQEAAEYAASGDDTQVYQLLKSQQFELGDRQGALMSLLDMDAQIDLDTKHREVLKRTAVIRAADFEDTMARQQVEWDDPAGPGPTISPGQLEAQLQLGIEHGIVSQSRYRAIKSSYYQARARNKVNGDLALAYASGSRSIDEEDGMRAYVRSLAHLPPEQVTMSLLNTGLNHNMPTALQEAGKRADLVFGSLGYTDTIDSADAALGQGMVQALDEMQQRNPGAYSRFMENMSDSSRMMVMYMRAARTDQGIADPVVATSWARNRMLEGQKLGGLRSALVTQARAEDVKTLQEVSDRELLGTAWLETKALLGSTSAANELRGSTRRRLFEDEALVAYARAGKMLALGEEFARVAEIAPTLPAGARKDMALAAVAARSIETRDGDLILPQNANMQQFFNLPPMVNKSMVGRALDSMAETPDGGRVLWEMNPQGTQMFMQPLNEDGQPGPAQLVTPEQVRERVLRMLEEEGAQENERFGDGRVVQRGELAVQFNGANTAGVSADSALRLRERLVQLEGITNAQYSDGKVVAGNQAFGVGISQTGAHFEEPAGPSGTYTQEQIDRTFQAASNEAIERATKSMQQAWVDGDDWLEFFGALAYQSPASARDADLLAAIYAADRKKAVQALHSTNAYKNSPDDRKAWYDEQFNKAW